MEQKQLSRYYKDGSDEYVDLVEINHEYYELKYHNDAGVLLSYEIINGHSLHYVEDACENWALGIKVAPHETKSD